jgi:hypothetical protein
MVLSTEVHADMHGKQPSAIAHVLHGLAGARRANGSQRSAGTHVHRLISYKTGLHMGL